jgi:hypothetical protein
MDTAAEEPWTAAKAKANFWKWFTIELIVMCFATYVFDLSMVWLSFLSSCHYSCTNERSPI